jgi:hypothetical protein
MSIFDIKLADSKRINKGKKEYKIHMKKITFNFWDQNFEEKNFYKS